MNEQALKNDLSMMGSHLNEAFRIYERLTKKIDKLPRKAGLTEDQAARFIAKKNKKRISIT